VTITTELFLVRHGEAINNLDGTVGGERGCQGLTQRGRDQAALVADSIAKEHAVRPFDVFYSTPRRRVRESAAFVTQRLPLQTIVVDDLRGPDHGDADGKSWQEVKTAFGGPPQHNPNAPYAAGSESWNQYLHRATTTLREILKRHDGERILVVGHGETIEAANVMMLDLLPAVRLSTGFITDHTAVTRWQRHVNRFGRSVWMLAVHNDTRHLSAQNR
jgi:probable phosphoglycerate mutase